MGYEIYTRLPRGRARVEFCGVGGIDLLPLLEGETDMIVVDCVQFGAPPGTVHCIAWDALPRTSTAISSHGLGLRETVEIGAILYPGAMPERITLVGIEGRCFDRTREYMTREVQQAVGKAVETVEKLVARGQQ